MICICFQASNCAMDDTTIINDYGFRWQFIENNDKWKDLDFKLGMKLENLAVNGLLKYSFGRWTYSVQKISKNKCVQINTSTKTQRYLRRIKNAKTTNKATIYLQYGFYTQHQMNIISSKFDDTLQKYVYKMLLFGYCRDRLNRIPYVIADIFEIYIDYYDIKYTSDDLCYDGFPKLLFGDHFHEKYRLSDMKRKRFGGQSCVLGHYDKKYGYGITTGFKLDIYSVGFDKWTELILKEFDILKHNLLKKGDIIIP
eukprot:UN04719